MVSPARLLFLIHKHAIFLSFILRNTFPKTEEIILAEFKKDLEWCPLCFQHQVQHCYDVLSQAEDEHKSIFYNFLRYFHIFNQHNIRYLKSQNESYVIKKFVVKNFKNKIYGINLLEPVPSIEQIQQNIRKMMKQSGRYKFCPHKSLYKFKSRAIRDSISEQLFWIYMSSNIEPLAFQELYRLGFPVTRNVGSCGFMLLQENLGESLASYYTANFHLKLKIMRKLLLAVLRLTKDTFGYFSIYLTDLNIDNILYNVENDKIYFIDLDSIFLVDTLCDGIRDGIWRHNYIKCNGCIEYSESQLCKYTHSDFNIFLACQLLREDLYGDRTKGFLHQIPAKVKQFHPDFVKLLDMCVDCPKPMCEERTLPANKLALEVIPEILEKIHLYIKF